MVDSNNSSDRIETILDYIYKSQKPDPAYLSSIRADLIDAAAKPETNPGNVSSSWVISRWRYAAAAALLLILMAVVIVGPAKVWAQIENWTAYLPGLGKVELSGTRVLEEPAVYSESGVTFRVEELIASPEETLVRIHISGLEANLIPSSGSVFIQWQDPDGQRKGAALRKEHYSPIYPSWSSAGCSDDVQPDGIDLLLEYDPIGPGVNRVQVQWLAYGMVPDVDPTDVWSLDINLTPVTEENSRDLLQTGYHPVGAEDTHNEITIAVENVFNRDSYTVLDASIEMLKSSGQAKLQGISLTSDQGGYFREICMPIDLDYFMIPVEDIEQETPGAPTIMVWPRRMRFNAADPDAGEMELSVESIDLYHNVQIDFDLEIGQYPAAGTIIPLDVRFDVDGFPIHISEARVVEVSETNQGDKDNELAVEFVLDSDLTGGERSLRAIWFSHYGQYFRGPILDQRTGLTIGQLGFAPDMIRNGILRVNINSVVLEQRGPWIITWDVPNK